MDNNNNNELFQKCGEIVLNKYKDYNNIPPKFKYFYEIYNPTLCGKKRKQTENYDSE